MRINNAISAIVAVCIGASAAACRDGVSPFVPVQVDSGPDSPKQLTFSADFDLNPTWSANSDTVFYSAANFYDHPAPNTLLQIARTGGIADLLSPGIDPHRVNTFLLPVLSPDRGRLAYVSLTAPLPQSNCSFTPPDDRASCLNTEPVIAEGSLRIRPVASAGEGYYDTHVTIPFKGADTLRSLAVLTTYHQNLFPYQAAFVKSHDMVFRPSWSPDGGRIVFSDGLMLRTWDGVAATSEVVPNSNGGVSPAWSPNGDVIAFSRIVVDDSTIVACQCTDPVNPPGPSDSIPHQIRWFYHVASTSITVMDPSGANAVELTEGSEPAWTPDGQTIYFTRGGNIYRIPRTGGDATVVANTQGGRSPSISPDGKWLAFARFDADDSNSDIWVIRLADQ
jgi:dipeptidyl aminopeptidase/acylaminoacyl peptidase